MRIVTLVSGPDAVQDAVRLSAEIRQFNAEIDFRLRFLDIEIEEIFAGSEAEMASVANQVEHTQARAVPGEDPLRAAASLALLLNTERPAVCVLVGRGELSGSAVAAARETGTKVALFGKERGPIEGDLDLGGDPAGALDRLTGVAREIG